MANAVRAAKQDIADWLSKKKADNQYALGYKAGLETAVKVCRDVVDSVSTTVHEQKLIDLVLEQAALRIASLPIPGEEK